MSDQTTDQANVPIPRPICATCEHPYQMHARLGNCLQRTTERFGRLVTCRCGGYEPKSYDIEPGPTPPARVDQPQQPPRPSTGDIQALVMGDLSKRRDFGIAKYGTPLQAFNGRDALMDAYQEALDLAVYLRQAIEERDEFDNQMEKVKETMETEPTYSMHIVTLHDQYLEIKPYSTCSCGWESGPQMTAAQAREEWENHCEETIAVEKGLADREAGRVRKEPLRSDQERPFA